MNKTSLTFAVRDQTGQSTGEAASAVNAALRAIVHALASGENVQLPGLGVLEPAYREARTGRNPGTGERIEIPAKIVVKFRAAERLLEYANDPGLLPSAASGIALAGGRPQPQASSS